MVRQKKTPKRAPGKKGAGKKKKKRLTAEEVEAKKAAARERARHWYANISDEKKEERRLKLQVSCIQKAFYLYISLISKYLLPEFFSNFRRTDRRKGRERD